MLDHRTNHVLVLDVYCPNQGINALFVLVYYSTAVRSTGFDGQKDAVTSVTSHQQNKGLQFTDIRPPDPTTALASRRNQVESLPNTAQPTVSLQNRRFRSRKNKRHQLSFYIHPRNGSRIHQNYFDGKSSEIKESHKFRVENRELVNHTTDSDNIIYFDENVKRGQASKKNNETRINSRRKRGNDAVSDNNEYTKSQPPITQTITDDISGSSSGGDSKGIRSAPGMPFFDPMSPKEIRVALGSTAHIPCMARNIGTKPVSSVKLVIRSKTFDPHSFAGRGTSEQSP